MKKLEIINYIFPIANLKKNISTRKASMVEIKIHNTFPI